MLQPCFTAEPLCDVIPESVDWLWEPFLPRGTLAVLDGDPGVGKSLLTLDLAARLSRGGPLPDGKPLAHPFLTLLLAAEDRAASALRPRVEAAGGNLERIARVKSPTGALMRLPADLANLEQLIAERQAALTVIDPVTAFLPPEVATGNDQCVRAALHALDGVAARTGCTVLLVRHLRKKASPKAIHRGAGSIGIIGAVRSGLLAAYHRGDPNLRVLAVSKTNLAETPRPIGYRVMGGGRRAATIDWTGPLDGTADELGLPPPAPPSHVENVANWLHQQLAAGPKASAEIMAAAARDGIPEITLRRAKHDARVRSHVVYLKGRQHVWYWYDPAVPWPNDAPFRRPSRVEEEDERIRGQW
jgi:hypothetical protein